MLTFKNFLKENLKFETGKTITFEYIHNKQKSPYMGATFGQDIEPAGFYIQEKPKTFKPDYDSNIEVGTVTFKNPLIIDFGGGYRTDSNWKKVLSKKYNNKKKRNLSKAIMGDGYDAIVTIENGHSSEIVDLTKFK